MPVQTRDQAQQANQSDQPPATTDITDVVRMLGDLSKELREMKEDQHKMQEQISSLQARSRPPSPSSSNQRREYSVEEPPSSTTPAPPVSTSQTALATATADTRWRPEEIGTFDGNAKQVKHFTDRLKTVAAVKGSKIIQSNLVTVLREEALGWYRYELGVELRWSYDTAPTIDPWCKALLHRFGPSKGELLHQLRQYRYGVRDLSRQSAVAFAQDVLSTTNQLGYSKTEGIGLVYDAIDPELQLNLVVPANTKPDDWLKSLRQTSQIWTRAYKASNWRDRPPDHQKFRSADPTKIPGSSKTIEMREYRGRRNRPNDKMIEMRSHHVRTGTDEDNTEKPHITSMHDDQGNDYLYDEAVNAYHVVAPTKSVHWPEEVLDDDPDED